MSIQIGSGFSDILYGSGPFNIFLGKGGNDRFFASGGMNIGLGGAGNDTMVAVAGSNLFLSGAGEDVLKLDVDFTGTATFLDWSDGLDRIDLSDLGITGIDQISIEDSAQGVVISVGAASVELKGVHDIGLLTADDFVFASANVTTTITFEDLSSSSTGFSGQITSPYEGLNWSNFSFIEVNEIPSINGYEASSGTVAAFNGFGDPASIASASGDNFDFEAFNASAVWADGLVLTVEGYDDGTLVASDQFVLDYGVSRQYFLDSSFDSVDEIVFSTDLNSHVSFDDLIFVI